MIYINTKEHNDDSKVGVQEIADAIDSPRAFTAKVLQQLAKANLLTSARGRNGGFALAREQIMLGEIVHAIDGDRVVNGCILGFDECSTEEPCAVHHKFVRAREELQRTLESTGLDEVKGQIVSGKIKLRT